MKSKTAFSRGTSLKNCSCEAAIFAYSIFCKILKIEISLTRKLNFGCFQNWFGRICSGTKMHRIAVLSDERLVLDMFNY